MKPAHTFVLLLASACAAAALHAQSVQPSGTTAGPRPPQPERAVSARASAAITAGINYNPPPPPKPAAAEEAEEVDLRDVDKPKNEIVRLPRYVVTAKRPPVFRERDIYSEEELRKLAMARYLTKLDTGLLNKWKLPLFGTSNEERAMEMYLEDERLQGMEDMKQDISKLRANGQTERADAAQKNYYDMFLRRRDDVHTETLTRQQGK